MSEKFSVVSYKKTHYDNEEEQERCAKIIKVVEKFVARICRTFTDKMVDATRNNHKYVILFRYNDDPTRGELVDDTIDDFSTKEILSGSWIKSAKRYFPPQKCKSVRDRIMEHIFNEKYNNGIDMVTKQKYNVSIFHYKKKDSVFPNGIIVSRDGIVYE